jgi:hypothetical protein
MQRKPRRNVAPVTPEMALKEPEVMFETTLTVGDAAEGSAEKKRRGKAISIPSAVRTRRFFRWGSF